MADKHGFSFGDCDGDLIMIEESILYLLSQPPPSSDFPMQSFECPFEDSKMEPLPFRQENSNACQIQQQQDQSEIEFVGQKMAFIDVPIVIKGRKRDSQDTAISQHHGDENDTANGGSLTSSDHQSHAHVAESIDRFLPSQEKKWNGSLQRLIKFKNEFGHCCVPYAYSKDLPLARWVKRQRHQHKKLEDNDPTCTLPTSRLEQLESIGFVWHSHAAAWLEKLNELKDYKQQTGNCNVPSSYPENTALSTWVKGQRRQYKLLVGGLQSSTMTIERFGVLEALDFLFEPRG